MPPLLNQFGFILSNYSENFTLVSYFAILCKYRTHARPTILHVKFMTALSRRSVLTMRPVLEPDQKATVFIRPDLTPAQQELDKKLRDELMTKGKDHFCIHRGKIIPWTTQPEIRTGRARPQIVQPSATKSKAKPSSAVITLAGPSNVSHVSANSTQSTPSVSFPAVSIAPTGPSVSPTYSSIQLRLYQL